MLALGFAGTGSSTSPLSKSKSPGITAARSAGGRLPPPVPAGWWPKSSIADKDIRARLGWHAPYGNYDRVVTGWHIRHMRVDLV